MNLEEIQQNQTKKILQFSVPAIISMVFTAWITVIDGFFMGNAVGKEGIAAVNLGLPVVYLYLGVGLMISVGGVAIAGMLLGSGDREGCNQVFRQTIFTAALCSFGISVLMLFCFRPMLSVLHAEGKVLRYFREYYWIMLLELPVMVINSSFGMFIRSEGNPSFFMKITVINGLCNVVLDYVFACVFFLGAAGIALASLGSALIAFGCILYYFFRKAKIYHLGKFRFSPQLCLQEILNGSSEFIGEMSTGIAMFAYNFVLMQNIGVDGVTAFTIVGYLSYVFSMVVIGFGQGASPLMSFCYGANEKKLAAALRRKTNQYVLGAGAATYLIMALFSDGYSRLFVQNAQINAMIKEGMLLFMISFFFAGINAVTSFYYTSTGRALESAVISLSRGLVILLLCIFILPVFWGMTGVWLAAPVTEMLTLGITMGWLFREKAQGIER